MSESYGEWWDNGWGFRCYDFPICGAVGALLLVLFTFMSKASDTSGPTSGPVRGYTRQQVRCMFGRWVHSGGE